MCIFYRAFAYTVQKGCGSPMNRHIGMITFFIAIGMLLMLIIESKVVGIVIIGLLLLIGYNCYCRR